jgi:hypothetical protein
VLCQLPGSRRQIYAAQMWCVATITALFAPHVPIGADCYSPDGAASWSS